MLNHHKKNCFQNFRKPIALDRCWLWNIDHRESSNYRIASNSIAWTPEKPPGSIPSRTQLLMAWFVSTPPY